MTNPAFNPGKNQNANLPQSGRLTLVVGQVVELDEEMCRVRVKQKDQDDCDTYWLPVAQRYSLKDGNQGYWIPEEDTYVMALVDESGDNGAVLCAVYNESHKPPKDHAKKEKTYQGWRDKSFVEYDNEKHELTIKIKGKIKIECDENIEIICGSESTINSKAIMVIGGKDNDSELNGPDTMTQSGQL